MKLRVYETHDGVVCKPEDGQLFCGVSITRTISVLTSKMASQEDCVYLVVNPVNKTVFLSVNPYQGEANESMDRSV